MCNYRIITDSCCDFPKELLATLDIEMVNLTLLFRGLRLFTRSCTPDLLASFSSFRTIVRDHIPTLTYRAGRVIFFQAPGGFLSGVHLYAALGLGRLRLFTGRCPSDTVGKLMLPHGNCPVSQEIVVDRAAAIFLLCAEKELALRSQVQDMGGILQGSVYIV